MLAPVALITFLIFHVHGQNQGTCKDPYVEQRLLSDDVRFASPFYVIALPKTPRTQEMDNVCYTYFENNEGGFFHIMSITFKNGTNTYYQFSKGDIINRMGIAEAKAISANSDCIYHDYTLKPICNVTVFILYRCFISGQCSSNIDIGATPGVDVRVTLAASPQISPECRAETETSLRDTSALNGGNYVILPQKLTPNCITKYDNLVSIGNDRALGPKEVSNDLSDRFADNSPSKKTSTSSKPTATQASWSQNNFFKQGVPPPSAFNPYGSKVSSGSAPYPPANGYGTQSYSYAASHSSSTNPAGNYGTTYSNQRPGQTTAPAWPPNSAPRNPSQWNGQTIQPGAEMHYHIWQSAAAASILRNMSGKNANVYYHVHSWENPPGCCKCT